RHRPARNAHASSRQGQTRTAPRATGTGRGGDTVISLKFVPLILKQIVRHRTRTLLTVAGVATAMFLFVAVQAMHHGVTVTTRQTAEDNLLIVYREDRY